MTFLYGLRARLEAFPLPLLQLAMRLAIVWVFWRSGQIKLANMEIATGMFRDEYKVPLLPPEVAAWLATGIELAAPALILVGLATRLATLPLVGLAVVIQLFVYPVDYPTHLPWLAILLFILVRGPGPYSLDALLFRQR